MSSYRKFIEQVDLLGAKLQARYSKHLVCRAGCSGCCHHHLSVFAVEAEEARAAIDALPAPIRARVEEQAGKVIKCEDRGEPVACPLLVDDRCSIYESRPLICRTQGLPLLMEAEDGEQEVDFCPLNFTEAGAIDDLDENHLAPLDVLNLRLALLNLEHCHEAGLGAEASGERIKMADIILKNIGSGEWGVGSGDR
ncbi:MAG: YkgJ family cysteine cluster protein, partial [Blastocatellia bacterium]